MRNLFLVCVVSIAFAPLSSGAPQKPGTYTPVPLIVTVHPVDSANNLCAICDDGGGPYIDGQEGVKATIDQWGDIIIDFQTTRTKIRGLKYNYPSTASPVPPAGGWHDYLSTLPLGNGALQAMVIGTSIFVASCPLYNDPSGQPQYRHGFYRDCGTGLGPEGSRLVVTRRASNEWEVESESDALARVFSATTKGRAQVVDYGLIRLPFKMTLTAKP
jgi:hypothetical protein